MSVTTAAVLARMENDETVPLDLACPKCGEDRFDMLSWSPDDFIRCGSCGEIYDAEPGMSMAEATEIVEGLEASWVYHLLLLQATGNVPENTDAYDSEWLDRWCVIHKLSRRRVTLAQEVYHV